ncbi:hypothetical protein N0V95_007370 [Ascochyta clinopodiicola]|nr:hypothetical protein N0V95_007370 [Ascochyta clinopodiicola]
MTIPNPNIAIADGYKTFTSGASSTEIANSLWSAFVIVFITYNVVRYLEMDPFAFADYTRRIYRASIDHIKRFQASTIAAAQLYAALYCISKPIPKPNHTLAVETVHVPGGGTLAMIHGLPPTLPTAQLSQILETTLFCHFQPQLRTPLTTPPSTTDRTSTEPAQIDTSRRGLWRGTCVQNALETSPSTRPSASSSNAPTTGAAHTGATTSIAEPRAPAPQNTDTVHGTGPAVQHNVVDNDAGAQNTEAPTLQTGGLAPHYGSGEDPLDRDEYTRD